MAEKIVLAYSGGLDTSVIIRWLKEQYGYDVAAFSADLGQGEQLEPLREKALRTGASQIVIEDLRREFLEDFCMRALAAQAVYEGKYLLSTALGRPLIAKYLVDVARMTGATAVAHGSTGKGNDQVRFDVSIMALAPELKVVAPLREWDFSGRADEIEYAQKHGIPVEATKEKPYSIDRNLWGISIECGVLEDPWAEPPNDAYLITASPEDAPGEPLCLEIGFQEGRPISLDGEEMSLVDLVPRLNELGGRHGVGRCDLVEDRLVGIKSREIYEAPGATILYKAYAELEQLVLDRETLHFKQALSDKYAQLVYFGLWFSPLREALDSFFDNIKRLVTGVVRLKLHKGNCTPTGRKSPHSLYQYRLATYDQEDAFEHKDGEAFCKLWGLPWKVIGERGRRRIKE